MITCCYDLVSDNMCQWWYESMETCRDCFIIDDISRLSVNDNKVATTFSIISLRDNFSNDGIATILSLLTYCDYLSMITMSRLLYQWLHVATELSMVKCLDYFINDFMWRQLCQWFYVAITLSIMTWHVFFVIADMLWLLCHFWHVATTLSMLTCRVYVTNNDM